MAELRKYIPPGPNVPLSSRMDAVKEAISSGEFDPQGMNYTDYERQKPRTAFSTTKDKAYGQ